MTNRPTPAQNPPIDARPPRAARHFPDRFKSQLSIDNLGLAWLLLLIGSFSFANLPAAAALSGQLNWANLVRYGCIVGALALLAPEFRSRIALSLNPLWLFAIYVTLCVVSTVWSVSPLVTFGKAAELAVATAAVVFAANRASAGVAQLFNVSFWFGVASLAVVLVGYFVGIPGFAVQSTALFPQMDAWFLSSNNIGYLSALTATVALDRMLRGVGGRALMSAVFLMSIFAAVCAQGRTGLLCFLLGVVIVLLIHRRFKLVLVGAGVASILLVTFSQEILAYLLRGEQAGSLQTLSGRTLVWQAAWDSFVERPLFGSGFGVGSRYLFLTNLAGAAMELSSAHNGFMELLTGVGLIGLVPWAASLLWTIANAFRAAVRGKYPSPAAIIPMMFVITVMSSGAGGWFDFMLGYFLCCVAFLQRSPSARSRESPGAPRSA